MSIRNIVIHDYQAILGKNKDEHHLFQAALPSIIKRSLPDLSVNIIDLYNCNTGFNEFKTGNKNRLCIFVNSTRIGAPSDLWTLEAIPINSIDNSLTTFYQPRGDGLLITNDGQTPILAEYNESENELFILLDLFREYTDESLKIFEYIISELNRLVFYPKQFENSWHNTANRDVLTARVMATVRTAKESYIRHEQRNLQGIESDIRDYRNSLKSRYDSLAIKRRTIETEQNALNNLSTSFVNDLNIILTLDKVKDVLIIDNCFNILTVPLQITTDKEAVYHGGMYQISIDPSNSTIKFFNNETQQGYWTDHDPHPHVNGDNGEPCLGNIDATVIELCSQMQLYALTTILIDYLESANTGDVAGSKVKNWPLISPSPYADEGKYICELCHEHTEELRYVYDDIEWHEADDDEEDGYNVAIRELRVCDECRDNEYTFNEEVDEYILNG